MLCLRTFALGSLGILRAGTKAVLLSLLVGAQLSAADAQSTALPEIIEQPARRHALVIGISKYESADPIPSAKKDAETVAALLAKPEFGFKVNSRRRCADDDRSRKGNREVPRHH